MDVKVVPDTSAIINGSISQLVEQGKLKGAEIIIHHATVAELEVQANEGKDTGLVGLEELKRLRKLAREGKITLRYAGEWPAAEEIKYAKFGAIDAKIRELARKESAKLVTSDRVQALTAEAYGIPVLYVPPTSLPEVPSFERFFDEKTMSVHLREGVPPMAKKGKPGEFVLVKLSDKPMTKEEVEAIAKEIIERANREPDAYIEKDLEGCVVVQYRQYRIVIAHPPFSDAWEITLVRPIVKKSLEDYHLSEKLLDRLRKRAEGILIAGAPGAGKSTFAQALAEFYARMGKVVKTMESPRDLQVPQEISQYAPLEGDMEKTADVLLLVRPDYTIYDELRKTRDFEIFADMRLAGVGMIGVVHASRPIEAVQRFVGRVELGLIPQIVDTVIFIEKGEVSKVLTLKMVVKVPTGMKEEDLARPVIEVRDFDTGALEYEIYTFGEETVVVPVKGEKSGLERLAEEALVERLRRMLKIPFQARLEGGHLLLLVPSEYIPQVIGKRGKRIEEIERKLGISIDVRPMDVNVKLTRRNVVLKLGKEYGGKCVRILVDGKEVLRARANKKGIVRVSKRSEEGQMIEEAVISGKRLEVVPC